MYIFHSYIHTYIYTYLYILYENKYIYIYIFTYIYTYTCYIYIGIYDLGWRVYIEASPLASEVRPAALHPLDEKAPREPREEVDDQTCGHQLLLSRIFATIIIYSLLLSSIHNHSSSYLCSATLFCWHYSFCMNNTSIFLFCNSYLTFYLNDYLLQFLVQSCEPRAQPERKLMIRHCSRFRAQGFYVER